MPSAQVSLAAIPFLPKAFVQVCRASKDDKSDWKHQRGSNSHFPVKENSMRAGNGSGITEPISFRDQVGRSSLQWRSHS